MLSSLAFALFLGGCATEPTPVLPPSTWTGDRSISGVSADSASRARERGAVLDPRRLPWLDASGSRIAELGPAGPTPPADPDHALFDLLTDYTGATLDPTIGKAMDARIEEFAPGLITKYGVAVLDMEEVLGTEASGYTDGLCEPAALFIPMQDDGTDYLARALVTPYTTMLDGVGPKTWAISEDCVVAIEEAEGDLSDVVGQDMCVEAEEVDFFRDGSDCRRCLEFSGDWTGCVESEDCEEEAQSTVWFDEDGVTTYYDAFTASSMACAPDWTQNVMLLVPESAPQTGVKDVPQTFDHSSWQFLCAPFWDRDLGEPAYVCFDEPASDTQTSTLVDGIPLRIDWIRQGATPEDGHPAGEGPWWDRFGWAATVTTTDGVVFGQSWAGGWDGIGRVSAPVTADGSGWGLNPRDLRPDGTSFDSVDDTFARDWLAAVSMVLSANLDGGLIYYYNHDTCSDWEGPDNDGSYRCIGSSVLEDGWDVGGVNTWWDQPGGPTFTLPLATLGSTGMADPGVPGDLVVHIAATDQFADFESCQGYPHRLVADQVDFADNPDEPTAGGSLQGQSYKFGKDPEQDIRLVFNTNLARGHCPSDGDG